MKGSGEKKIPVRERITNQIAEAMTKGHPPWRQPWTDDPCFGPPVNVASRRRYNGINVLLLMLSGWHSRYWGTFRQWSDFGAWVQKKPVGVEHWGTGIVFFSFIEEKQEEVEPGKKPKKRPMTRFFTVFNAAQVEPPNVDRLVVLDIERFNEIAKKALGRKPAARIDRRKVAQQVHEAVAAKLDGLLRPKSVSTESNIWHDLAEELVVESGAKISYLGQPCYRQGQDKIFMTPRHLFQKATHYYETLFHELAHWSMAPWRLDLVRNSSYAFNELVAEISACFVAAEVGIPLVAEMLPENQKYLKTWLRRMGDDPKFIFDASRSASKVADYLLAFVGRGEQPEEEEARRSAG